MTRAPLVLVELQDGLAGEDARAGDENVDVAPLGHDAITIARTCAPSATSPSTASPRRPRSRTWAAAASAPAAFRSAAATSAPSAASCRAIACPIPLAAPVTIAVRPSRGSASLLPAARVSAQRLPSREPGRPPGTALIRSEFHRAGARAAVPALERTGRREGYKGRRCSATLTCCLAATSLTTLRPRGKVQPPSGRPGVEPMPRIDRRQFLRLAAAGTAGAAIVSRAAAAAPAARREAAAPAAGASKAALEAAAGPGAADALRASPKADAASDSSCTRAYPTTTPFLYPTPGPVTSCVVASVLAVRQPTQKPISLRSPRLAGTIYAFLRRDNHNAVPSERLLVDCYAMQPKRGKFPIDPPPHGRISSSDTIHYAPRWPANQPKPTHQSGTLMTARALAGLWSIFANG